MKKIIKEHLPWNLSYKMAFDARPSWAKQGMPALFAEFVKLVKEGNNKNRTHLDIGCGNGVKTVNFALAGLNTVGIDVSDDGFLEASELIKELRIKRKCKVIKANGLKLPFENSTFTSASDILMFTHLKPKDYKKYIAEVSRILKNGAYFLLVVFSDKDEHFHGHNVSKKYTFKFDPTNPLMDGYSHYHGMYNVHFGKNDIKRIFKGTFEIVKIEEFKHPLYSYRKLWNIILRKPIQ